MSQADSFYKTTILDRSNEIMLTPSLENENSNSIIKKDESILTPLTGIGTNAGKGKGCVFYISDIHLDHKIYRKFGANGDKKKVERFVRNIARKLIEDYGGQELPFLFLRDVSIVIAGDTSHSFEINKIFYKALSQALGYNDVFVVLGNHELWEFDSVEQAVSVYSKFFDELPNIHLLQNALFIDGHGYEKVPHKLYDELPYEKYRKLVIKESIIPQEELKTINPKTLRDYCAKSKTIIFGTIGFAPFNKKYNFEAGIYRKAIKSGEEEKRHANEADGCYRALCDLLPKNRLIILSHMPLEDWSTAPHLELWTYFSGHTHINRKQLDENGHIFADNQIGYYGKTIKFKACMIDSRYDYFAYYGDGIYDITEDQYRIFYYGTPKSMRSVDKRLGKGQIKMLKNNDLYLFLFQTEQGRLWLLEGGSRRALNSDDIYYYYNNLTLLNETISKAVSGIRDYLKQLSQFVKHIGGIGHIHGNIVDIDYYNHIMVDIRSGAILPYFAYFVNDRDEYPSVQKLLEEERPDLYKKYLESGSSLPVIKQENAVSQAIQHSTDTSIYKDSRIMLKIQDMLDYNVVRFWNDEIIDSIGREEKPRNNRTKLLN